MNVKAEVDDRTFQTGVRRLMQLTGQSMREILREQAGFFCQDALKLTPPTGNAPIRESFAKQRGEGISATTRDVRRAFAPIRKLRFLETPEGNFGEAINKLMRKGNYPMVEALLRKIGIRDFISVVQQADRELHNRLRDRRGRVTRTKTAYFVDRTASINAYLQQRLRKVGYAKSGWITPLKALGRALASGRTAVPGWISGHTGPGVYHESGTEQKPEILVGNAVPYIQKYYNNIIGRAYRERLEKLPMQVRAIERAMQRKLKAAGYA